MFCEVLLMLTNYLLRYVNSALDVILFRLTEIFGTSLLTELNLCRQSIKI